MKQSIKKLRDFFLSIGKKIKHALIIRYVAVLCVLLDDVTEWEKAAERVENNKEK